MPYDVARVRKQFPALDEGAAHFDGPGGTQVAAPAAEAVAGAMRSAVANRGRVTEAEQRADRIVSAAREAVADLLGADRGGIVFGRSMTALAFDFAATIAHSRQWQPGDEIVVTSLDHDANVTPWRRAAEAAGVTVRLAEFDPASGELPAAAVEAQINDRTRLVAVTGASNLIGTRPDLPAIAATAHAAGALFAVDGVHLTPHAGVDVAALGADLYFCSTYKFCGPHLGVLAASPQFLETLQPAKLEVSTDAVPERFELGTLPYELLAGVTACVDWLADLDPAATGTRQERLRASMTALEGHEAQMRDRLQQGLRAISNVTVYAADAAHRTPTTLFRVGDHSPAEVHVALGFAGVNAPAGHFYARTASHRLGLGDAGGVRAGIAAYTDAGDVDRLLDAVASLAARATRQDGLPTR